MAGWITTSNGIELPPPLMGSGKITISTFVDGGRNTNGDFIGSVVGGDKLKIECSFPRLTGEQLKRFLQIFDRTQGGRFVNRFRVYDPRIEDFVWLDMYVGDRTGTPYMVNPETMKPGFWSDVQANLIQV